MNATTEAPLAAPGAGLPTIELHIARLLFRVRRWTGSREAFTAKFVEERSGIEELVASCEEARRSERVIIARRRGMEDSSRNWSVWMTLDHLRITNEAFARIVTDLAHGRVPQGTASTAAVKPSPDVTSAVEPDYERSCDAVLAALAGAPELKTARRFAHPWFGPLNAFGWAALAGTHMGIHRGQIASIVASFAR